MGVFAHGDVVLMIVEMHIGHREAPFVLGGGIQCDAIAPRHVLTDQPHARHVLVAIERRRELAAPGSRIKESRHERQADRQRLHLETADETALRIVRRLVGDDAGHRGAAPHPHRLVEDRVNRAGHVPHVVAADLAIGVVYFDKDGKQQRQKARIVCVAGNSIETPRLLLLSKSSKFPNGLANSSGQVGRNYMRHMTGSVYAVFDKPVRMWRGTTMAGIVTDEAANNPQRGFVGGFEMETLSIGLPFMAAFLDPGAWGREFTSALDGYENMSGMWLVGEDMPQESNRVTLDPAAKDKWGLAVANVHFDDHQNDITMRKYAHKAGSAVYEAVGATRTFPTPPYPSTHNLGTCRMSENSRDGVCNKFGQAHDVRNLFISDGSQFTTGGAENPTLTIVSLAIRQAEYIADEMGKKNI